ncbi:hypothetical protein AgCh_025663 [Apium graveolens]
MTTSSSGVLESRWRNREVVDSIFRVGSLNVETKWKGNKTKEANGFKLWYSGVVTNRNGVGIMLSTQLRNNVVEVIRFNDRVMMIKLVVVVNIVGAYAPHAG